MKSTRGSLGVLQAIDSAKREGWLSGYRSALHDVETMAESRGIELGELLADMRADATAIEREGAGPTAEASRDKLAADRLRDIAAARKRGATLAEIAKQFGISKSHAGRLVEQSVPHSSHRGRNRDTAAGAQ